MHPDTVPIWDLSWDQSWWGNLMEIRDHTDHLQLQLGYSGTREVTGFRHSIRNSQEPGA